MLTIALSYVACLMTWYNKGFKDFKDYANLLISTNILVVAFHLPKDIHVKQSYIKDNTCLVAKAKKTVEMNLFS